MAGGPHICSAQAWNEGQYVKTEQQLLEMLDRLAPPQGRPINDEQCGAITTIRWALELDKIGEDMMEFLARE